MRLTVIFLLYTSGLLAQITNGMEVHYPLDGNVLDATANNRHGTVNGVANYVADPFGNPAQAYAFNGPNYIDLPLDPVLQPTTFPVTIAFWINPTAQATSQAVFGSSVQTGIYGGFWINIRPSGQLAASIASGISIGAPYRHSGYTVNSLSFNQWQHVTIVIRGYFDMDFYIDCQQVANSYDGSGTGGPVNVPGANGTLGKVAAGNTWTTYNYSFSALDDFMFWSRELNASEIASLCASCQEDSVYIADDFCSGSSYAFNGQNLTAGGQYSALLTNVDGCDSLVVLDLTEIINGADTNRINAVICEGQSYLFAGTNRSVAGRYTSIVPVTGGCDSVTILELLVQDTSWVRVRDTICSDQSYALGSQSITASGNYADTLQSTITSCDSIVELELTVLNQADTLWISQEGDPCRLGYVVLRANGPGRFRWQNGQTTDTLVVNASGSYSVESFSPCGQRQVVFEVDEDCLPEIGTPPERLFIPNVFTPNDDNVNDVFLVSGNGVLSYEIIIFNRWGEEVYRSTRLDQPWDGTFKGSAVSDGVYMYVVNYMVVGERYFQEQGHLTIFR